MALSIYGEARVRVGGNSANGAIFDPILSVNQISKSDVACANSTTITSATSSFTSDIVNTYVFVVTATGGWRSGYIRVTAFNSSTSITLEQKPVIDGVSLTGGNVLFYSNQAYNCQDAAQLTLTDIACSNNTTVTSATGGFTALMIGNAIRITGGGSTTGYYLITAHTDTNTVTVDRTPGTVTAGSGRVGGAAAQWHDVANNANATGNKVVAGNTVWIRGAGTDDPSSVDYSTTSAITPVGGGSLATNVRYIGENGRPYLRTNGTVFYTATFCEFRQLKLGTTESNNSGIIYGNAIKVINCRFDANGTNTFGIRINSQSTVGTMIKGCDFYSGTTTPTFNVQGSGVYTEDFGTLIIGCSFRYAIGHAIVAGSTSNGLTIVDCVIYKSAGSGVVIAQTIYGSSCVRGCVLDANGQAGITGTLSQVSNCVIENNVFSNHANASYAGLNITGGQYYDNDMFLGHISNNAYYNNTNHLTNYNHQPGDVICTSNPYSTADSDFTSNGTAGGGLELRDGGIPQVILGFASTELYKSIGFLKAPTGGGSSGARLVGASSLVSA